jgi:hypothetical protein
MELDRAKTIADVSQTLINAAKVEVEFAKATGQQTGSKFFAPKPSLPQATVAKLPGA